MGVLTGTILGLQSPGLIRVLLVYDPRPRGFANLLTDFPRQISDLSLSRVLVRWPCGCRGWVLRQQRFAVQVVRHGHAGEQGVERPEPVQEALGALHQFRWLADGENGALPPAGNVLMGVEPIPPEPKLLP
ncbi:hypothetical protein [Cyanobium sp. NIES-981]|uniref:hypothetical protein n=1 Tax=Cyanobium sp. NIES-981 TaxID=1851505 RepID=UPI0007DDCE0A|nr:hypothetical protein [Cyanobium sp. NIES-981]SBO44989.1 protein of unknown function [Cyanobium sp. NIES-981]